MSKRNSIGLLLTGLSLGLLIPGLALPAFTLKAHINIPLLGPQEVYNETRSVLSSIESLTQHAHYFPAFLLFFFGIIVPVSKAAALSLAVAFPKWPSRKRWFYFVGQISKWAMADVLAVAMLMAMLIVSANNLFVGELRQGYYFFAAYCLVSILSAQVMEIEEKG